MPPTDTKYHAGLVGRQPDVMLSADTITLHRPRTLEIFCSILTIGPGASHGRAYRSKLGRFWRALSNRVMCCTSIAGVLQKSVWSYRDKVP
jgi:hypothetical protein